jgi:hypothetical protein
MASQTVWPATSPSWLVAGQIYALRIRRCGYLTPLRIRRAEPPTSRALRTSAISAASSSGTLASAQPRIARVGEAGADSPNGKGCSIFLLVSRSIAAEVPAVYPGSSLAYAARASPCYQAHVCRGPALLAEAGLHQLRRPGWPNRHHAPSAGRGKALDF